MGFFDFLIPKPPPIEELVRDRWGPTGDGTFFDAHLGREGFFEHQNVAWRVGTSWFESWFQGIEHRLGLSLGRRLAHAAAESYEYQASNPASAGILGIRKFSSKIPSGREISSWSSTILEWQTQGLGRFKMLDDSEEIRIIVERPASGPICSGIIASAWEKSTGKRHRFRWSENKGGGLLITLAQDDTEIPSPKPTNPNWNWKHTDMLGDSDIDELWKDFRMDSPGDWSIRGERKMFLHRDLFLRFEDYCIPYVDDIKEGRSEDYTWEALDDKRSEWWTAAADSARERFVAEGHHVLVRDPSDWVGVARRHLSYHGLGGIDSTAGTDEHGGIRLGFTSVFHPAIASGVLLGCWERAHGRNGRASVSYEEGLVNLELRASREIAS